MSDTSPSSHAMAKAMKWATRATSVAAEMVLPGLAGQWADKRLGTSFLTLLGFALGLSMAIFHLVQMAREVEQARIAALKKDKPPDSQRSEAERSDREHPPTDTD